MVCLVHKTNTINKNKWYKDELSNLDLKIDKHLEHTFRKSISKDF